MDKVVQKLQEAIRSKRTKRDDARRKLDAEEAELQGLLDALYIVQDVRANG